MKRILLLATLVFMQLSMFSQNTDWYNEIDMDPYDSNIVNIPTDVIYDDSGAMWTSYSGDTYGSISKYKDNIFTIFCADSSNFPATQVYDLCKENGVLYAATDSGIVKYNGTSWEIFLNSISGLHSNCVYGLDIKNNKLYARTDTTLNIYNINSGTFSYLSLPTNYNVSQTSYKKRAVYVDANETVYLGDTNSVYVINDDTITTIYYAYNYYGPVYIDDIKFTNSSDMFIKSIYSVFKLSGNEFVNVNTYFPEMYAINSLIKVNLFIDVDTVYIVIPSNTVYKFTSNEFIKYFRKNSSNPSFEGVLFRNQNSDICVKQYGDIYTIFDFEEYLNVTYITDDNTESLDINNVNAMVGQNGRMFWFNGQAAYEIPAGSGKHSLFSSTLWITAIDDYSLIYCAGGTFNSSGFDYFPGPLNDQGETDSVISDSFNKVWKINRLDIEEMRYRYDNGLINQPGYQIPEDILTWPANGNTSLGYSQNIAPYYDANGDNIYDVYAGDYPLIHGDQEIYSLYNDNLSEHTETNGVPLKIEIHQSFYAYSCSVATDSTEEINNTTFFHYKIINKSNKTYTDTKLGFFTDADVGDAYNDLLGTNVDLKSVYFYNQGPDGDGTLNTYGENPPAIAVTYLKGPKADNADWKDNDNDGQIDEVGETCDFNNCMYFINGGGAIIGGPVEGIDYYYMMRSKWKDISDLTYSGTGAHSSDTTALFAFSGDYDSNLYSTNGIDPGFPWYNTDQGDKRAIVSMGGFTFEPGDTVEFDIAIVWSRDTTDTVDSNNVHKLFTDIENIRYWYDNNIDLSCLELDTSSIGISTVENNIDFDIYPNPVKDVLFLEYSDYNNSKYRITDINGRILVESEITNTRTAINTKDFAKGVYIITIYKDDSVLSRKFVK